MLFGYGRDDQARVEQSEILAERFEFGVAAADFKILQVGQLSLNTYFLEF